MKLALLQRLNDARTARQPAVLVTSLAQGTQALVLDGHQIAGDLALTPTELQQAATAAERDQSSDDQGLFFHSFAPAPRLILVGAVHIAQALVPMAQLVGYDVVVVDPRRAWANEARFPGITLTHAWPDAALRDLAPDRRTAVVALTHDPKIDDPALQVALSSPAFYVGALGSKVTHAKRCQRLTEAGLSAAQIAQIDGPIGLALGAKTPAEIALSILAKMTQVRRGGPTLIVAP